MQSSYGVLSVKQYHRRGSAPEIDTDVSDIFALTDAVDIDAVDKAAIAAANKELGLLAIRLIVDGFDALDTLSRAGVVHRDISLNNLLYSLSAQAWRLTDFDCASSGPGIAHSVGTDGYIAPE
uniref:Protein kinase domain-containing protein n=1 Tax=Spongospora subterranea TaxID=70186 RepID=A0A0H5R4Y2_9EUKA|eukprot:CRZ09245.1 hypothetical protein [Spongospora subterranea]